MQFDRVTEMIFGKAEILGAVLLLAEAEIVVGVVAEQALVAASLPLSAEAKASLPGVSVVDGLSSLLFGTAAERQADDGDEQSVTQFKRMTKPV